MNVTVDYPGPMKVEDKHVQNGKTLVYAASGDDDRAIILWMTPETAAQWIEALTPLAAQAAA